MILCPHYREYTQYYQTPGLNPDGSLPPIPSQVKRLCAYPDLAHYNFVEVECPCEGRVGECEKMNNISINKD